MKYLSQIKEKSEPSEQLFRPQFEGLASDHSALQQNMNNNFSNDQIQINDPLLGKAYDTPTTPANYHFGRIQSFQRSLNSNGVNQILNKEMPSHLFSPNPMYFNPLSPEQNPYLSGLMMEDAINHNPYPHNPLNYSDLEEFQHKTPLPSSHLYNHNLIQSNYSYKNTPLIPISPHVQIMQSGGGRILSSHNHDQYQFTPYNMQNNINNNNNLFTQLNQTPQNQSPFQSIGGNRGEICPFDSYGMGFGQDNDPFDQGNNLVDWAKDCIKEEDKKEEEQEEMQQFGGRLKKKLKVEDKELHQRIQEDNADLNSYTEINQINAGGYGEIDKKDEKLNQEQNLNSTVKTMKQNFNISPENQKYQITPIKNNFDNQSFMTPNNQQNPSNQIESYLQTQTQQQKNASYNNSNIFKNNQFEIPSNQRSRVNQSQNNTQSNGNRTAQKDGNASDDENCGNRNERGLRILSKEVLDIVREKNETTYKEVTEEIIQNRQKNNQSLGQDEQNIKRRVYDALNVLIAAELITKTEKKKIKYSKPLNGICSKFQKIPVSKNSKEGINNVVSNNQLEKQQNQKTYFKNSLDSKKERLKRKNEILKDLILKMVASKHLIKRNMQSELIKQNEEQNVASANSDSSKESTQTLKCISLSKGAANGEEQLKLKFPFIACQSPPDNSKMSFKKFTSGLAICSMKQLKLKGDIDLLVQIYNMDTNTSKGGDIQEFLDHNLYQFLQEIQSQLYDEEVKLEQEFTVSNNRHIQQIVQNNISNEQTQDIQKSKQLLAKNQIHHNNVKNEDEEDSSQITTNQSNNARHELENQNINMHYQGNQGSYMHQNCDEYEDYIN